MISSKHATVMPLNRCNTTVPCQLPPIDRRVTHSNVAPCQPQARQRDGPYAPHHPHKFYSTGRTSYIQRKPSTLPTFVDIKDITIQRSQLTKLCTEPFFDKLVQGCFVRIGIGTSRSTGPVYRLCFVKNVDATNPDRKYKLDDKTTHKFLNLVWGSDESAARWQMAMVSNSPPTRKEFDQWLSEVQRCGARMPSRKDVWNKYDEIQNISCSFVYSFDIVKQMLEEKKQAAVRPLNVAVEKDRLRKELGIAQIKHHEAEIKRILAKLEELEASQKVVVKDDSKAVKLAEMNTRNKVENYKNAFKVQPVNACLKAGGTGYDPFSRRWTRPQNYFVRKASGENEGESITTLANSDDSDADEGEATSALLGSESSDRSGVVDEIVSDEAAENSEGRLVDTSAPVDKDQEMYMLHNFDLPISLDVLYSFGGVNVRIQEGFIARKQRIEATMGREPPRTGEKRHAESLTIGDYKRLYQDRISDHKRRRTLI